LPARLAEISERIDASIDPIRPHFFHCNVRRKISIDNDATYRVSGLNNRRR